MMKLTDKNIEDYIHRFMEGETTNAEEQAIYRFFRSEHVPEHLLPYQAMFAWYEEGMPGEPTPVVAPSPRRRSGFSLTAWSTGIAAAIIVTLGIGLLCYTDHSELTDENWACYEGSYIEVGGKRLTDIRQILPLILAEQAEAEQKEQLAEQLMDEMDRKEKRLLEKEMMLD